LKIAWTNFESGIFMSYIMWKSLFHQITWTTWTW